MVESMSIVLLEIRAPLRREDLPELFLRTCALFQEHEPDRILCDVTGVEPDAVSMDALARLQLAARRSGCVVRLRNTTPELRELVALMGLSDVLPDEA